MCWSAASASASAPSRTPARHGIETVYQDLALIPQLPVYLNLFLGHELTRLGPLRFLDKRAMRKLSRQYLDDINVRRAERRRRDRAALRRPAAGDRRRPSRARGDEDPAARRAARGHGRTRVAPHHRPRQGSRLERPGLDHRDRPQLRPSLRALRPHQRHAGRSHHDRPARARDVARGADRADGLELPQPARGGLERWRPDALGQLEAWFVCGSQHMYGAEQLRRRRGARARDRRRASTPPPRSPCGSSASRSRRRPESIRAVLRRGQREPERASA